MAKRRRRNISRLQRCFELFCCAFCLKDVFCRDEYNDDDADDDEYEKSSDNSGDESWWSSETDDNVDDIIVTRVYVSASAENIVKQHDLFYPKCQSQIGMESYVDRELERRPNLKTRNTSEWQIPSTNRDVRDARIFNIIDSIGVQTGAEYDMFADTDLLSDDDDSIGNTVDEAGDAGKRLKHV